MNVLDLIRQQNSIGGAATTRTVPFHSLPTSGNTLLACFNTGTTWANITPPTGWTEIAHTTTAGAVGAMWYKVSDGTEADCTVVSAVSAPMALMIMEITGTTGTPLDVSASNSSASAVTTLSSGTTGATAQADEVAIAFWGMNNALRHVDSYTNDFERISDLEGGGNRQAISGKILTAAAAQESTATWTVVSSGTAVCAFIATFKLTGTPTPPTITHKRVSSGYAASTDSVGTSYDTLVTFPVTAGKLYLAFTFSSRDAGVTTPQAIDDSHSGACVWTEVANHFIIANARRGVIHRSVASSTQTAASITITTSESGTALWWYVMEIDGFLTGGTNGSAAIGQFKTGDSSGGTSVDITFDTTPAATSIVAGVNAHGINEKQNIDTSPAGHTLLYDRQLGDKGQRVSAQWYPGSDGTLHWDWATSIHAVAIAVEVLVAVAEEEAEVVLYQYGLAVSSTPVSLTVPDVAMTARIFVRTGPVVFTRTGTAPTATKGYQANPGDVIYLNSRAELDRFQAIRQSRDAALDVEYFTE